MPESFGGRAGMGLWACVSSERLPLYRIAAENHSGSSKGWELVRKQFSPHIRKIARM